MSALLKSSPMIDPLDSRQIARVPDPEVASTAKRRQFSSAEKQRILAEADRCTKSGEIGALLRREGIYSSMLTGWRKQRGHAERAALMPRRRGPKPAANLAEQRQIKHLARDNTRLQRKLDRAHLIIDVQKKLCTLLGLPTAPEADEDE